VILSGNDAGSEIYVRLKIKTLRKLGIYSEKITRPDIVTTGELLGIIDGLNQRPEIDGILVQTPLPPQVDKNRVLRCVKPDKDVDGFHPQLDNGRRYRHCSFAGSRHGVVGRIGNEESACLLEFRRPCLGLLPVCWRVYPTQGDFSPDWRLPNNLSSMPCRIRERTNFDRIKLRATIRVLLARPIQLSYRKLLLAVRCAAVALRGRSAAALEIRLQ
jgi:hypothetical protein